MSVVCLPRNWLRKFYSFIDNWNISQVLTRYVPIETWYVRLIIYFEQDVRPFETRNIYEERCLLHVASPAALVAWIVRLELKRRQMDKTQVVVYNKSGLAFWQKKTCDYFLFVCPWSLRITLYYSGGVSSTLHFSCILDVSFVILLWHIHNTSYLNAQRW